MIRTIALACLMTATVILGGYSSGQAGWVGPHDVASGAWGTAAGQFGIRRNETADLFPRSFGISQSGKVVIGDSVNEVIHIFDHDGSFLRDIASPVDRRMWPYRVLVDGECAVVGYVEFTHTFNILSGELVGFANKMGGAQDVREECSKIYVPAAQNGAKIWRVYTPSGQLLHTYAQRPAELGHIRSSNTMSDKSELTVIEFNDRAFTINPPTEISGFVRDKSGNLYAWLQVVTAEKPHYRVYRYNLCGRVVGFLDLPENEIIRQMEETIPRVAPVVTVVAEYGTPLIAANGDVYTWKRTGTTYSIIKWAWEDEPGISPPGPYALVGISLEKTGAGLRLGWLRSLQDPGCVTGYEIARSTTAGSGYSTIATVGKGVTTYEDTALTAGTYYYKVRAMAGSDGGAYSDEVSGTF